MAINPALFFPEIWRTRISDLSPELSVWGRLQDSAKYLGHPLFLSRRKSDDFEFIVKRVASRLEGWQTKFLFKTEKATLIKSAVQALPVHSMSTFRLPVAITDKIDALTRGFRGLVLSLIPEFFT